MIQLQPHQQRAFDNMQSENVGQIIIPTGGGKTYIMIADLKEQLRTAITPINTIVVAPRILLSNQLHAEFSEHLVDANVRTSLYIAEKLMSLVLLIRKRLQSMLTTMMSIIYYTQLTTVYIELLIVT